MRLQKIVYYASGENKGTYDPLCFLENFTGDLNETDTKFYNWDCDIPVTVPKYGVNEQRIPEWMDERDFLDHHIELKYSVGLAGEQVFDFSRFEFFRFSNLSQKQKYWYGWASKSKNEFIQSVLNQMKRWLRGEVEYKYPLTDKQWAAATKYCPLYKADKISNSLYYNRWGWHL